FGKDLQKKFSNPALGSQFVYQQLYDSTKTIAEQFPQYNRYVLQGTYKSSVTSEISLGAFNVPQGSVTVTAGGQKLVENVDYTVDYNLGRVKILNQGLLNSGVPINVSYENNALFSFQTKTLFGVRLDYYINDHFTIGGTMLKLWERPYTTKLNVGYDPISNGIFGLDGSYTTDAPLITRLVNALPLIDTKDKSSITVSAEAARLQPGHSKSIGKDGVIYIDDFEGTQTTYDLRFPFISWKLASTPQDYTNPMFPEATHVNSWDYGFNRAKLSWYNIDPFFWTNVTAPDGIKDNSQEQSTFYSRQILQNEIFPAKDLTNNPFDQRENTFDIRYEPRERGPYNFDTTGLIVLPNGNLGFDTSSTNNLTKRWAGIQRSIDQTDFEQANIEYIQLWVLDPFLYDVNSTGGDLYIDLGNISEDVLKDSKFFYENGLSPAGDVSIENSSIWGFSPKVPPITDAFDNDPNARQWQDVGYDGLRDASTTAGTTDEQHYFNRYLTALQNLYGANSPVYLAALNDPCNDDYLYFDDGTYNSAQTGILDRYRRYNNPENNSPISTVNAVISSAATNQPESEDLNNDNTITENESYFHYKVHISPGGLGTVGQNFVTDQIPFLVPNDANGFSPGQERWVQIKIPISAYQEKVGSIEDFKSIRFVRMYLTNFDTTVIMRFARMELVRNQWRKYLFSLEQPGEYIPGDNGGNTYFNVSSVSLEENSSRQPINYVLPPGISREQIVGQIGTQFQNEQSLSVQICNLKDGDARAVYKNINLDLRQYQELKLFVHAEGVEGEGALNNGDLTAFLRLGTDFTNNFYEYEKPLVVTVAGETSQTLIWPEANNFDIILKDLVAAKEARNAAGFPVNKPFIFTNPDGSKITIVGNPDLGIVVTAMLGIRNPKSTNPDLDNGEPKCAEIWYDELRLSGFVENGGDAAIARMEIKLADLGNVAISGSLHTIGFGQLEQKLNERFKDNFNAFDVATTLALGKFFPKKLGLQLPMYAGISKTISNPQYDPYDHDILLKDKLNLITDGAAKSAARKAAQTYTSIGSVNFTNVRIQSQGKNSKIHIYSPQNLNITYAYTRTFSHTPIISSNLLQVHHAELGYAFPGKSKFIYPFQNIIGKGKYLKLIKDFNLNFLPSNLSFRTAMDRQFGELHLRPLTQDETIIPTYNKFWTWDRIEGFKFDISKALNLDFNATARTRIDEPNGRIDTKEKKDSVWKNIKELGRTTNYTHSANLNYTVPINKIPILDWTQVTARYGSNYGWLTAPLVLDSATNRIIPSPLGNTITNNQNIALNGDFNIRNLYNKWKFFKKYDTNAPPAQGKNPQGKNPKDQQAADEQPADEGASAKNKKAKAKTIGPEAFFIRLPLMLKKVSANYTENHGTVLPGYLPKAKFIGQDFTLNSPGWDFIFGYQPDSNWLNTAANKGWLSADTTMNYQFVQTSQKQMSMKATLEPFKDFNVDVNFSKTNGDNVSEYFKKPSATAPFEHLSRTQYGTFTMSYISIKTSFVSIKPNQFSATFLKFQDYRQIISARYTAINPNSGFIPFSNDTVAGTFYRGYGPYSQDVLIPAFLAAYSGQSASAIGLGLPFNKVPMPNWRVQYNGITKMAWAKKIWSSVTISHGYTSTLAISSFTTALNFQGQGPFQPIFIDPTSNNYVSYYDIPSITISEQFAPLLGIDMTWKNSLTTKFEYKRSRNLSFSFLDYQLTEMRNSEFTTGVGYKFKHVPLPWKVNNKRKYLKNDLNFQTNVSYSDNTIYSQKLDQLVASQPTSGTQTISISPSVDYTVNGRLNVRVFLDKRITNPKISSSYPIRYTDGGVTLRFTLGQ
ncbi:MAG TPA: cell surface protein SprA, partial [Chitinophagales bacterium]|nr:cell surface protein SprA [Chitinophagales bacterium]